MSNFQEPKFVIADDTEMVFYGPFDSSLFAAQWALSQGWHSQGRIIAVTHPDSNHVTENQADIPPTPS
jgi:YD repeat-containing protein